VAKRELYIALMAQGTNNAAACRLVGVNRRTGTRWSKGRHLVTADGWVREYPAITGAAPSPVSPRFLSEPERAAIADGLRAGDSARSIAAQLGRSPSTISRELANNVDPTTGRYYPLKAHHQAERRRARYIPSKLSRQPELGAFVQECLGKHWSPEQISKALPQVFPDRPEMRACHETIYQALYHPGRTGLHRDLAKRLRSGRPRRKRRRRADQRTSRFGAPMTMITKRPAEVAGRLVAGHWEGDLLMGRANRSAIGTLVERTSRTLALVHLPAGHAGKQMKDALVGTIAAFPAQLARSLTWDQGSEMGCHHELTEATGIPVYFCDPASPWQRGSNENMNGLLRQYFPKGTDLSVYGPDHLQAVADEVNSRPRKVLGWQSPADCLERLVSSVT
jgi:IS30 family transposase